MNSLNILKGLKTTRTWLSMGHKERHPLIAKKTGLNFKDVNHPDTASGQA